MPNENANENATNNDTKTNNGGGNDAPVVNGPTANVQGFVSYQILDADGKVKKEVKPKPQFIVDAGLNNMANNDIRNLSNFCRVGTGTTEPNAAQVGLVSQHGSASGAASGSVDSNSGAAPWWHQNTRTFTFAANTITGASLSELGFFSAATGGSMFSRFLFVDGVGTPTPITVLAGEVLIITYSIRQYVPNTDATGSFNITINGTPTNFNYTARAANASSFAAWGVGVPPQSSSQITLYSTDVLGPITSSPSGSAEGIGANNATYVNGDFFRTVGGTASNSQANFAGGIGAVSIRNNSGNTFIFQISFSPKIPKTSLDQLVLGNTFFKWSWTRGAP